MKTTFIFLTFLFVLSCKEEGEIPVVNYHYTPQVFKPDTIVYDIDSNIYKIVNINGRKWMAENLRVTRYNNGDTILYLKNDSDWNKIKKGAYCFYNNDSNNLKVYGNLYNYYVVSNSQNVCPVNWHVPSLDELKDIEKDLGGSGRAGGILKDTGTSYWIEPNTRAIDSLHFTALPAGLRNSGGAYNYLGKYCWFLSSTYESTQSGNQIYTISLKYSDGGTLIGYYHQWENDGYSIRCIEDF